MSHFCRDPKVGSMSYVALQTLYNHGGVLPLDTLALAVPAQHRTPFKLRTNVIVPLTLRFMARVDADDLVHLTQAGYAFARNSQATSSGVTEPARAAAPIAAPARVAPAFVALPVGALAIGRPARPGMDDYKRIPSLFCGQRVYPEGADK